MSAKRKSNGRTNFHLSNSNLVILVISILVVVKVFFLSGSSSTESENALRGRSITDDNESLIAPSHGKYFYFAYASDMLAARLKKGGTKTAKLKTVAKVPSHTFDYTIYSPVWKGGVADLIPKEDWEQSNPIAWGVVYEVDKSEREVFDAQKGVQKPDAKYESITVKAIGIDGNVYQTESYAVRQTKRSMERVAPTVQYHSCVYKGAIEKSLPKEYLNWLSDIRNNGNDFKRKSVGKACDL